MKRFQTLLNHNICCFCLLLIFSCNNEGEQKTSALILEFEIMVDNEVLVFGDKKYLTSQNQFIAFERFNFYLSNIQLLDTNANDSFYEEDSYHLIKFDANQGKVIVQIEGIPSSFELNSIILHIGVDDIANSSIDQLGDLDPTNGMAWDWNTGYKFLLLEGRYFPESETLGQEIKMHIGTDKNYFKQEFVLGTPQSFENDLVYSFQVDAMSPFGSVDLSEGTVFMNDERGDEIAQYYKEKLLKSE